MRSSAQLRTAATLWGALSLTALLVAVATFPYGLLRSFSSPREENAAPYASEGPAIPPVEAPPEPERLVGVASPASQTEIWFAQSRRLVRLGGIFPIRPDDPNFLANNQYAYTQIFSGQTLQCVTSNNDDTFRCQTSKGEDLANILVNRGLASYREVIPDAAAVAEDVAASPTEALGAVPPLEVGDIRWRRRPDERDFARLYPRAALETNQSGRVVLDCLIQQSGTLGCNVVEEEPAGAGFGDAARELSGEFRAAARTEDGQQSVGRHVRLALAFRPNE